MENSSYSAEILLKRIESNMSDIICIHDLDGTYRYITPSVKRILGYSPEEIIGTSPYQYFHPEDIEHIKRESHAVALMGRDVESRIEYRCRKKDGRYIWVQTQATPIFNNEGAVFELITVTRDISLQKKSEEHARKVEASYRQIFLGTPAVGLIIDPESGNILDANRAAVEYYGYSLDELKGLKIFHINVFPKAEVQEFMAKVSKQYYKAIPFCHKLKDGSIRNVEVYSCPVNDEEKVILHSIIIDVTDREKAQKELLKSSERLELVVQGAKAGVWDWDMKTNQVFYDNRWKAILGYQEDELDGGFEIWKERWHPEDQDKINYAMQDYVSGKTDKYEIEYRLRHKDGSYRWIMTSGKVTRDSDGHPTRWTGFNIDITEHKITESLYMESEKLLRDFAEAVPDTSFIIDENGRYLEVFGQDDKFHIPKKEFINKTIHEVLPEEAADFVLNEVKQALTTGTQRSGLQEMNLGNRLRHFSGRTVPLSYKVEGKSTVAVIAVDITEQQKNNKMLQMTYELRRRSDYINDILSGRENKEEDIAFFSKKIGIEFNAPLIVLKILSDRFDLDDWSTTEVLGNVQKLKDGAIDALSGIEGCIAWDFRDGIGVLLQAAKFTDELEYTKKLASQIINKIAIFEADLQICVGISNINSGVDGLKKGCRQALTAALAARSRIDEGIAVVHYREAGIFQFMPDPIRGESAKEYIEQHLGKLLAYDRLKKTNYLETLEDYLRGISLRETAGKQHLHIKSIVFRQKSIAKMLNVNLNDYQTKQALALAIQLLKLNRF